MILLYTKNAEQSLHILRNFAFEPAIFTINRMNKTDHCGVKGLTMEPQVLQKLAVRRSGPAIDRIAQQCVTNGGHVYAHLMRATCFKLALYQRRISEWLQQAVMSHGPFAPIRLDNRHFLAIQRRSGQ